MSTTESVSTEADATPNTQKIPPSPAATAPKGPRRRLSRTAIAILTVSIIAIGGWVAFAIVLGDNNNWNAAYQRVAASLQDEEARSASLEGDLTAMTAERDDLQNEALTMSSREAAVEDAEAELETREADVAEREKAVDEKEAYIQETSLSDGSYTVGVSMKAGTYRTQSGSSSCYWAIYRSGTNYDDIVNNDFGSTGVLTVSVSNGQDFETESCGTWKKIG